MHEIILFFAFRSISSLTQDQSSYKVRSVLTAVHMEMIV